jgi:hypothetical protein
MVQAEMVAVTQGLSGGDLVTDAPEGKGGRILSLFRSSTVARKENKVCMPVSPRIQHNITPLSQITHLNLDDGECCWSDSELMARWMSLVQN